MKKMLLIVSLALVAMSLQAKDMKWVQVSKGTKLATCYDPYYAKISATESANTCTPKPGMVTVKKSTGTDPKDVCYDVCDKQNGLITKGWSWSGTWGTSTTGDRCQCIKS
jgi:hypothetical protein